MKKCATCDGIGKVKEYQNTLFGKMLNVIKCPVCKGTGKIKL